MAQFRGWCLLPCCCEILLAACCCDSCCGFCDCWLFWLVVVAGSFAVGVVWVLCCYVVFFVWNFV